MERLIETSLWVDFTRSRTPLPLRMQIRELIMAPESCICEPIVFEILRSATPAERKPLAAQFSVIPMLGTSRELWRHAATLGQTCRDHGFTVGPLDLLIAAVALEHDAEVVTFDADYSLIVKAQPKLRVQVLTRAA